MIRFILSLLTAGTLTGTLSAQTTLATIATAGNGGSAGGGVYFDATVAAPLGINVISMQTLTSATIGTTFTFELYTRPGTATGFQNNSAGWTLATTGSGISAGVAALTTIDVADFTLPAGVNGIAIRLVSAPHAYTNGNGTNQTFSNADLTLSLGSANNVFFSGTPFTPACGTDRSLTTSCRSRNQIVCSCAASRR